MTIIRGESSGTTSYPVVYPGFLNRGQDSPKAIKKFSTDFKTYKNFSIIYS